LRAPTRERFAAPGSRQTMLRSSITAALTLGLAACSVLGPPSLTLSRSEIAERAFVDRSSPQVKRILKGLEQANVTGPEVAFQLQAQRIELAWSARLPDGPMGVPLSLRLTMSGTPVLNEQKNGIDLADTRIEDVRIPALPFINLDRQKLNPAGAVLGTLPLLQFHADELTRDGIVYQPGTIELGTFGLRVALVPK
jgi:hypothetical protein